MTNIVEIEIGIAIGIDHKGNAGMFDTDPDPDKNISGAIMA
jgi:hypothetical protein